METAIAKEFKKEGVKHVLWLLIASIIALIGFYYNTNNRLAANEYQIDQLKLQVEQKADQSTIEKRIDKLENKIDYLIELQIDKKE